MSDKSFDFFQIVLSSLPRAVLILNSRKCRFSPWLSTSFLLLWEKFFSKFTFTCLCFKMTSGSRTLGGDNEIQSDFLIWPHWWGLGGLFSNLAGGRQCIFLSFTSTHWSHCALQTPDYSVFIRSVVTKGRNLVSWEGFGLNMNAERRRITSVFCWGWELLCCRIPQQSWSPVICRSPVVY